MKQLVDDWCSTVVSIHFWKETTTTIMMTAVLILMDAVDDDMKNARRPVLRFMPRQVYKTAILRFFLQHWYERFAASSGGHDTNGDCPIDVLCRDKHVSIQAIKLMVKEFQANK
jgi:hypothetical protein